jgi:hypothetical protein
MSIYGHLLGGRIRLIQVDDRSWWSLDDSYMIVAVYPSRGQTGAERDLSMPAYACEAHQCSFSIHKINLGTFGRTPYHLSIYPRWSGKCCQWNLGQNIIRSENWSDYGMCDIRCSTNLSKALLLSCAFLSYRPEFWIWRINWIWRLTWSYLSSVFTFSPISEANKSRTSASWRSTR